MTTDSTRITQLNLKPAARQAKAVMYWMQVDQRPTDNWALVRAGEHAREHGLPLVVVFVVHARVRNSYVRHYDFMLRGLAATARELRASGIGFVLRIGDPTREVPAVAREVEAAVVVTDQSYLAWGRRIRQEVADALDVSLEAVDGHTIVPPATAYPKAAYGAYILRPKLRALRERYITEIPAVAPKVRWTQGLKGLDDQDTAGILAMMDLDGSVGATSLESGPAAARQVLDDFINRGFRMYDTSRNDPVKDVTSHLSAYLHFGQISSQRVAYDVLNSEEYERSPEAAEGFLDELITWRELAVNHVYYRDNYNKYESIPAWAQRSLAAHEADPREYIYERTELEAGTTHDELWNAAQQEMFKTGRMHGYMRMYWAKKVLEWTPSAREAIDICVYLNDKYFLDGRDPNGYAGILWAIGGLHDRPWFDRPIYGQVRYMSYGGAKGKFDVAAYIDAMKQL